MDISSFNGGANIVPGNGAFAITPSDVANLSKLTRAIYVGGGGNAAVTFADGTAVTLNGLVAGLLYPFQILKVSATNTTATNLVGIT